MEEKVLSILMQRTEGAGPIIVCSTRVQPSICVEFSVMEKPNEGPTARRSSIAPDAGRKNVIRKMREGEPIEVSRGELSVGGAKEGPSVLQIRLWGNRVKQTEERVKFRGCSRGKPRAKVQSRRGTRGAQDQSHRNIAAKAVGKQSRESVSKIDVPDPMVEPEEGVRIKVFIKVICAVYQGVRMLSLFLLLHCFSICTCSYWYTYILVHFEPVWEGFALIGIHTYWYILRSFGRASYGGLLVQSRSHKAGFCGSCMHGKKRLQLLYHSSRSHSIAPAVWWSPSSEADVAWAGAEAPPNGPFAHLQT